MAAECEKFMAFEGILQEPKSWGQQSNMPPSPPPPARAPISSFTEERTEGLLEGGRGPGTNLALNLPPPPR